MRKFGFKFFSTNFKIAPNLIKKCAEFASLQPDMFIEFTAIPSTDEADFRKIKQQIGDIEVRIHACTSGFDAANKEMEQSNKVILASAQRAADIFNSSTIVVHAGFGHEARHLAEAARQFRNFNDQRIVVENLPYYDNNGDELLVSSAEDVAYMMRESNCGFCFDFSHAIGSAIALHQDIEQYLHRLFALKPTVYHLCDGHLNKAKDEHLHFGRGNYPLKHYLRAYTDENAYITMETGNGFSRRTDLRSKDYEYLKSLSDMLNNEGED